jgi:hypothetical protein
MEPHWVNLIEHDPEGDKLVWVLVVERLDDSSHDIGYAKATLTTSGWTFSGTPEYTRIVAWLESDRDLSRSEVSNVPKDRVRF